MKKISSDDKIVGIDDLTIHDFWSWAYSDILNNRNRSVFAEFLVGYALGVTDTPRIEWDAVDLRYRNKKIEVKSSAYLQSWNQDQLSAIRFDIAKKMSWDAETNKTENEPKRAANCYVFCLYSETDSAKMNILNVSSWDFYILSTEQIERELKHQKSVGIKRIKTMCNPVDFSGLKNQVNHILGFL